MFHTFAHENMVLDSIAYSKLVSWLAYYKHNTLLGKLQIQKILFIAYGMYYAKYGEFLFTDDKPQVWPYGPVFPRVYRRVQGYVKPSDLTQDEKAGFLTNENALRLVAQTVSRYYDCSTFELSLWSHMEGGAWDKTYNENNGKWGAKIDISRFKDDFMEWPAI